jgi:propanediol dehydratase small subunit
MKTSILKRIVKEELKKIMEGETIAPAKPTTKPGEKTKHPLVPKQAPKTKPKAKKELDEADVDGMMDAIVKRYKDSKK